MYSLEVSETADETFSKLSKKDKTQLEIIHKKLQEILADPYRFKPLHAPLQNKRRVHIDSHFVLIYEIDESRKTVIVMDYDHHDHIYKR